MGAEPAFGTATPSWAACAGAKRARLLSPCPCLLREGDGEGLWWFLRRHGSGGTSLWGSSYAAGMRTARVAGVDAFRWASGCLLRRLLGAADCGAARARSALTRPKSRGGGRRRGGGAGGGRAAPGGGARRV